MMHEAELNKNGYFFTDKYMRFAFTNGTFDIVAIKRHDSFIKEAFLCKFNSGERIGDNITSIEDVLKLTNI